MGKRHVLFFDRRSSNDCELCLVVMLTISSRYCPFMGKGRRVVVGSSYYPFILAGVGKPISINRRIVSRVLGNGTRAFD